MTRRKAAAADVVTEEPAECLLCGGSTPTFADPDHFCVLHGEDCEEDAPLASFDLCGRCNVAFASLARALEAAQEARSRRVEVVAQVAGQLELDEDEWVEHELDVDAVLEAVRAGNMGAVSTMDLGSILQLPTLTLTERDLVKGELWRRS